MTRTVLIYLLYDATVASKLIQFAQETKDLTNDETTKLIIDELVGEINHYTNKSVL